MSATVESLHPLVHEHEFVTNRSYTILCKGANPNCVENYLLIPVEGTGFVVIKQEIDIDE